jgi:hypothetical protein
MRSDGFWQISKGIEGARASAAVGGDLVASGATACGSGVRIEELGLGPCVSGSVCGETDDAREVDAEWGKASGVSMGEEGYLRIEGLVMMASLGEGSWGVNAGIVR